MFKDRKINSMGYVGVFLILVFIILVTEILYFIERNLAINDFLYNGLVIGIIIITASVATIAIFQFIKVKYALMVKAEVKEELDNYKTRLGNKNAEINNRIVYFEANYSKQLKKIMKDYSAKTKEIEDIKKDLNHKLSEINEKAAKMEVETCIMKIENLKVTEDNETKERMDLYQRIIKLCDRNPGICSEEFLDGINANMEELQ